MFDRMKYVFVLQLLQIDGHLFNDECVFLQSIDPITGYILFTTDFNYAARYIGELELLTKDKVYIEHMIPNCKLVACQLKRS